MLKFISFLSVVLAVSAWSTTPQQAAQRWAQFAPGMNGKVVYGQGIDQNGKIWVLNLTAGTTASIANYHLGHLAASITCCFRWSPSGKRIFVQNVDSVNVLNEDGSNMKLVAKFHQCGEQSGLLWGDWSGDSALAYSTGDSLKVVRTIVHTDNSPGVTEVLVPNAPIGGTGVRCWSSVGIDGDWLSYNDFRGNASTGGYHRPMLKNLKTGVVRTLIANNEDMCQLTMIPDPFYKTLGQMSSHLVPGTICDTNGNHVATLPQIGSFPQRAYSWSNVLEYFMSQGEGSTNTWAWIRSWSKRATSASIVVSDTGSMVMYFPDLWVKPSTPALFPRQQIGRMKDFKTISYNALGKQPNFSLYTISGSRVDARTAAMLSRGIYIIEIPGMGPRILARIHP